ncbi:MAG: glycogen synthase GlgA [Desulfonatronovibrionaceae bacterium]
MARKESPQAKNPGRHQDAPDIFHISSEIYPFSKSGGLADVVGILPQALHDAGFRACVITPLYGRIATSQYRINLAYENCPVGYPWPDITTDIYRTDFHGIPIFFIDRGEYFDRKHYYCTHKGDYFDNCERFIFFCRAAVALMERLGTQPRIVHAHDWHAALCNTYIYFNKRSSAFWKETKTVFTIHNLAFQGRFSSRLFWDSGLPFEAWNMDGVEFFNSFNLLKAGIAYSDLITTVSPTYASEILTPEFGCGMEGLLAKNKDKIWGILNGADYSIWDPRKDRYLPRNYSLRDLSGKMECKKSLLQELCLPEKLADRPVFGFIGRMRRQKGIDLVLEAAQKLVEIGAGLIVLGEGKDLYETRLMELVEQHPKNIAGIVGYTEEMAHKIQAGADVFLMPSRYEPCGLTQMYSLRYGTLPVASAVGGLKDTITPYPEKDANGFIFRKFGLEPFMQCLEQAVDIFRNQPLIWEKMRQRAMQTDFSWTKSAQVYARAYESLAGD